MTSIPVETSRRPQPARVHDVLSAFAGSSWIWLVLASFLFMFSDGRNTIALAVWLAPACLLRFLRLNRSRTGLVAAWAAVIVSRGFAERGMIPIPVPYYYGFLVVLGVLALLPYLADRWLSRPEYGFAGTLIFPLAYSLLYFLNGFGVHGSWGSPAYSQFGNRPLLQLLSVTGLTGIVFLIGWFAAVFNWVWERGLASRDGRRGAAIFASVYLCVILVGGARLALFRPASGTVRVASLSPDQTEPVLTDALLAEVAGGKAGPVQMERFQSASQATADDLLARSDLQARAGARIVFWSEGSTPVLLADEPALIAQGERLAMDDDVYLGMTLATVTPGAPKPLQNKLVMITPAGQVAWQYHKSRLTPGFEWEYVAPGDGRLRSLATPYGRLSAVICYDADFPRLLFQAGRLHADLVLDPSSDWRAIDPEHTVMASYRAIEEGFNLVRQANRGLSAAYDYQGHRLAAMDHFRTPNHTMVADVPTRGARTVYSIFGDWFAWLCLLAFAGVIVDVRRRRRATRTESDLMGSKPAPASPATGRLPGRLAIAALTLLTPLALLLAWGSAFVPYRFRGGGSALRFVFFLLKMLMPVLAWPICWLGVVCATAGIALAAFFWRNRGGVGPAFVVSVVVVALSLAASVMTGIYIVRITGARGGFTEAFGAGWRSRIPAVARGGMLRHRWSPVRFRDPDARVERNLVYWTIPGTGRRLRADLWLPPAGVAPSGLAYVYFHGSGWSMGDKGWGTDPTFRHLAAQGHVVMDVAYRLAPETRIPGMVHDARRAVAWMKANGPGYGVNPSRIVLAGGSAGGQIALLAAYTPESGVWTSADLAGRDVSVRGVVSEYGPVDMRAFVHSELGKMIRSGVLVQHPKLFVDPKTHNPTGPFSLEQMMMNVMGGMPGQAPAAYDRTDIIRYVRPGLPATLLIQGQDDSITTPATVRRLAGALRAAGVPVVYLQLPGTDHGFDLATAFTPFRNGPLNSQFSPPATAALYAIDRFLEVVLRS